MEHAMARKFPSKSLVPSGGQIYCHIFENRRTGLRRNLFWSITVDFKPIRYGDERFTCSMTCEWIAWSMRDWRELDEKQIDLDFGEDGIESSFYMTKHDIATHTRLSLHQRRRNVFGVKVDMMVDFHGYYGGDENPAMPVHAEVDLAFIGLLVIPANLSPKPTTPAKLKKVASHFVDLAAYKEPEPWMTHGFIFRPAGSAKRKGS
jgi:hypothetical protein